MTTYLELDGFEVGYPLLNAFELDSGTYGTPEVVESSYTGTYGLQLSGGNQQSFYPVSTNYHSPCSTPSVGVWVNPDEMFDDYPFVIGVTMQKDGGESPLQIFLLWNTSTHTLDAYYVNSGYRTFLEASGATLIAAGSIIIPSAEWFHAELYLDIDTSAGTATVRCRINGQISIDESGVSLPSGITPSMIFSDAVLATAYTESAPGTFTVLFDDLVLGYDGYTDNIRVAAYQPSSDVVMSWSPSEGSDGYDMLDDGPNAATYVHTDAEYQEATVGLSGPDLSGKTLIGAKATFGLMSSVSYQEVACSIQDDTGNEIASTVMIDQAWYPHRSIFAADNPGATPWVPGDLAAIRLSVDSHGDASPGE